MKKVQKEITKELILRGHKREDSKSFSFIETDYILKTVLTDKHVFVFLENRSTGKIKSKKINLKEEYVLDDLIDILDKIEDQGIRDIQLFKGIGYVSCPMNVREN